MKKAYAYLCLLTRIRPDLYGNYPMQKTASTATAVPECSFYHTPYYVSMVNGGIAWVMDSVVRLKSDRPHRILHIADLPEEIHMPEFDRTQWLGPLPNPRAGPDPQSGFATAVFR